MLSAEEAVMGGNCVTGTLLPNADRYLFCQGILRSKQAHEQTMDEATEGYDVNCGSIVRACDAILARNDRARICIIGSESAYRGSFDGVYASAKADIHHYVETKELRTPLQQLVAICPGIVGDAGMTTRRTDTDRLDERRDAHPKKRFVTSSEVAFMVHTLLYGPTDYISGTVIRMHGGLK